NVYRITAISHAGLTWQSNSTSGSQDQRPNWWTINASATDMDVKSSTRTWYDAQGRVIETDNADGLRSGTIFDGTGRVIYTGRLKGDGTNSGDAPVGGVRPSTDSDAQRQLGPHFLLSE